MILNIRDIDMESVSRCMSEHEGEFEAWYESQDAAIWREPLEEQLAGRLSRNYLRDFAVTIWLQSRLAQLRAENAEAAAQELPTQWIGHSCIGNVYFKTLDGARKFAEEMGYEGIYL